METDPKLQLALWRYGIISPALHRQANDVSLVDMLHALAQSTYIRPNGIAVNLSPETMRKWLYRYQKDGLEGLQDKERSDKGNHDVPQPIADAMFQLRAQHPGWTLALLLDELVSLKLWDQTSPSRSKLYRFADANGLMRNADLPIEQLVRPFAFDQFGQMWIADFMHGPKLWLGDKKRRSYLHVIIDDCTRYVVSGKFYPQETTESLIQELITATRRFGIPQRLYTDNGAAYSSQHLKVVKANLGIMHPRTPPRRPQGRSKVERFFRTVRDRFLAKQSYKNFDQINQSFPTYLYDYHHRIHSSLKCSPMQKRMSVKSACRQVPEVTDIEALFRSKRHCRVYNDGTIRIKSKAFEVPGCLPGSRVIIHYMPWDLSRIYYGDDMRPAIAVDLSANAHRFEHPNFANAKEDDDEIA